MTTVALAIGALTAMDRLTRDPLPPLDETEPRDSCSVALVLVGTDPRSPLSRLVDRVTGGLGFSHVFVDPCRQSFDGRPLVVDYSITRGVHWAEPDVYANRRNVRIELDATTGTELWGCLRSRIGRPFQIAPMAVAFGSAANCVGLVTACLPGSMRARLKPLQHGPCLSPNTLALFFKVV